MASAALLFDLDGTLTDPIEGIWRSINFALSWMGYPPIAADEVRNYVGPPIDQTFSLITGLTSPSDVLLLVHKYRERYSDIGYSENVVYPGIVEALTRLSERSVSMAVCTSKRKDFADRILELFALRAYFEFVDGGEVGVEKWQQIGLLRASERVSNDSVMIGDRAVDLVAARRNGLSSGAVLWGYGSSSELLAEAPTYVFREPNEWLQIGG
jgi:phosphoglycolate phosphatase